MVRTRADCSGIRVGSKAAFKTTSKPATPSTSGKRKFGGAGNRYHPRETPAWQKEITQFLNPSGSQNASKVEESVAEPVAEPEANPQTEKSA